MTTNYARYNAKRRQDPEYRAKQAAWSKAWCEQHGKTPERLARKAEQMRGYSKDPTLRVRHEARWLLHRAIESGRVVPGPCAVCGAPDAEGHHVAYDMPLDVVWLCRPHHQQLHAEAKATGSAS